MDGCCSRRRNRPPPAVSRMARRTSMCYELPSGRRKCILANRPARTLELASLAPMGGHCSCHSQKSTAMAPRNGFGQFWDPATGRPTSPLMAGAANEGHIYTPAGDRLLSEIDSRRSVRDAATGSERGSRVLAGGATASHPDGRTMLNGTSENDAPCCGRCRRMRSRLPTEEPTRRQRRQGA